MTVTYAPDVTDKFCTQLIRRAARALVDDGTFPRSDLDDVIQDLRLALIEQAGNFDADKARWSTFVKKVVSDAAVSLRRRHRAQCRQAPSDLASLNRLIEDGDGQLVELGATVSEEEHRTGLRQDFIDHPDQVALALDVQAVQEQLTPELREICERLQHQSLVDVARDMGMSRTTLARRVAELRDHFRAAGLSPVT